MDLLSQEFVDPSVFAALPAEHQENIHFLDSSSINPSRLISLLQTINYCGKELPSILFPALRKFGKDIIGSLEGLGIQKDLQEFVKWMETPDTACIEAAMKGRLSWLQFAREINCPWISKTCLQSQDRIHLRGAESCPFRNTSCIAAAHGQLECLKYAHVQGCPWDETICAAAAENGELECLKYAHEQKCPWDWTTCREAARKGHLGCLKYAVEEHCPFESQEYLNGKQMDSPYAGTCSLAALKGHLDCLKYAHEMDCPWNAMTCSYAACNGHLDCLQYAHENGCPWDRDTCDSAAGYGSLECLQYAHENGCPWDDEILETVLISGWDVDCLRYAYNEGLRWPRGISATVHTELESMGRGRRFMHLIKCLIFAFDHGCPFDPRLAMTISVRIDSLELLESVCRNGGQVTEDLFHIVSPMSASIINWLRKKKYSRKFRIDPAACAKRHCKQR